MDGKRQALLYFIAAALFAAATAISIVRSGLTATAIFGALFAAAMVLFGLSRRGR